MLAMLQHFRCLNTDSSCHGQIFSSFDGLIDTIITALMPHTGGGPPKEDLCFLLQRTAWAAATDPRDKVYALLSLMRPTATDIAIDYLRTTAQVFADVVVSELQSKGTLATLWQLHDITRKRRAEGLPSWVPRSGIPNAFLGFL
jgi:hypothetical protein